MKNLYAIRLTKPGAKVSRYALYEISAKGKLEVVWPKGGNDTKELIPCQVFIPAQSPIADKYPAYHFCVGNVGYRKLNYLETELQKHYKKPVNIELIEGWPPSSNSY